MGYTISIVDTRTGLPLIERVEPMSGPYETLTGSIGEARTVVSLGDAGNAYSMDEWRDAMQQWHRTIVISFDGVAQYAGLVVQHDIDDDANVLTIASLEVRALLARRFAAMLVTYLKTGKFAPSGKSWRGLFTAVLREGFYKTPGDNWTLPFVIPPDVSGSESREWWMHKFDSIEDMLVELESADGGLDVVFDPRWDATGRLQWHAVIGSPRVPGASFEWVLGASDSPVSGYKESSNGRKMLSGVFAVGAGTGEDTRVGRSPLTGIPGPPIPDMDGVRMFTSVESEAELNAIATGEGKRARTPTLTYSFGLEIADAEAPVDLSKLRLGARTNLYVPAGRFPVEGWRRGYVIAVRGDVSSTRLALGVQDA